MADTLTDIKNRDELDALKTSLLPDNTTGDISPADIREYFRLSEASIDPRAGVIVGGVQDNIPVTATPVKLAYFTVDAASDDVLFTADSANDEVLVHGNCRCPFTLRFQGKWAAGEDLTLELRINDAVPTNPSNIQTVTVEGKGATDPEAISFTAVNLTINDDDLTAGGGSASVSVWISSTTGNFDLDQVQCTFGVSYTPYTIRSIA